MYNVFWPYKDIYERFLYRAWHMRTFQRSCCWKDSHGSIKLHICKNLIFVYTNTTDPCQNVRRFLACCGISTCYIRLDWTNLPNIKHLTIDCRLFYSILATFSIHLLPCVKFIIFHKSLWNTSYRLQLSSVCVSLTVSILTMAGRAGIFLYFIFKRFISLALEQSHRCQ